MRTICIKHVSSCYKTYVLVLLTVCPHTFAYISSCVWTCVPMVWNICPYALNHVSPRFYLVSSCSLFLLYEHVRLCMCPHVDVSTFSTCVLMPSLLTCILMLLQRVSSYCVSMYPYAYVYASLCICACVLIPE